MPADGDVVAKAKEILKNGDAFIIADLEPADLLAVADLPEAKNSVIMNIRSSATALRQEQCRQNVFHIIPDYAMRADALAQYLIWKKWPRWFVIRARHAAGSGLSSRMSSVPPRASAARSSTTRSMTCRPAHEISTQAISRSRRRSRWRPKQLRTTTCVWVINSDDDFGDYLVYRTYIPRPVVGTQGLQAVAWDKSYTESGAMHFQNAIPRLAKRKPVERDYTAWLALRRFADSAMKSGKTTPQDVKAYLLSDQFKIEGFKGQAMSFRTWDHQMRQPIILGGGTRVPVSTSPQEGFLHETNLTDTLGFDKPETKCKF